MRKATESDEKKISAKQSVVDQCIELRHETFRTAKLEDTKIPLLNGKSFVLSSTCLYLICCAECGHSDLWMSGGESKDGAAEEEEEEEEEEEAESSDEEGEDKDEKKRGRKRKAAPKSAKGGQKKKGKKAGQYHCCCFVFFLDINIQLSYIIVCMLFVDK
jgi:hypothetical protein